jgi:hypothetical protein
MFTLNFCFIKSNPSSTPYSNKTFCNSFDIKYIQFLFLLLSTATGIALFVQRLAKGCTTERTEFYSRNGQEFSLLHVVKNTPIKSVADAFT